MRFKYFNGVADSTDLKKRYRKLALELHPDKGGSHNSFVEMTTEYKTITTNGFITYPIGGASSAQTDGFWHSINGEDIFSQMDAIFKEAERRKKQERAKYAEAEAFAKKQRDMRNARYNGSSDYWDDMKVSDSLYQVIEDTFNQAMDERRSVNWFTAEIYKIEELGLNHFKFVKHLTKVYPNSKFEFSDAWVGNAYKGYVHLQDLNSRL